MKTVFSRKLLLFCLAALAASGVHAQVTNSSYTGADAGNWGASENWTPATVPNNTGTMSFNVSIADHAVTLDIDPTVSILSLGGDAASISSIDHSLSSAATSVTVGGTLDFKAETVNVLIDAGALADFSGTTLTGGTYRLDSSPGKTATLRFHGADVRTNSAYVALLSAGARIVDQNNADAFANLAVNTVDGLMELQKGPSITTPGSFTNEGYFAYYQGSSLTVNGDLSNVGDFRDPGTVGFLDGLSRAGEISLIVVKGVLRNYDAGTKTLSKGRYFFGSTDGAQNTLQVLGGPLLDIVNNDASIILVGSNTGFLDKNGANALRNLATTTRYLVIGATTLATAGSLTNTDTLYFLGESHFTVSGDLTNRGLLGLSAANPYLGFTGVTPALPVDPPAQSSELKVTGNLTLEPASTLTFEVFGPSAPTSATVTGTAAFAGTLDIIVLDDLDATVTNSDTLTLLTANSISGAFSNVASGGRLTARKFSDLTPAGSFRASYNSNQLVLSGFLPHAGLLNISSRAKVQTGDNVAIAGFIVGGTDAKQILIRGIGPSLSTKGVASVLANPTLELFDGSGTSIGSNDDWQESQAAEIEATGIAPTDPRESALIATLNPGNYTATLRGVGNGVGVGLVEVYDLDAQPALGELTNISTRGRVETGDDILIGGIIIEEGEPASLIIRAIGPSLASQSVTGPLADPTLDLHDNSGVKIMSNDNWNDDPAQSAQFQTEGLAPTNANESALAAVLNPGNYTAIVRGKNNTQGVALVEFFKLN